MDKQIMDETHVIDDLRDLIDLMMHQQQLKHQNQHENQVEEEEQQERGNCVNKDDIVPSYEEDNYYSCVDSIEPAKVTVEKDQNAFDATILSEIDRAMKNHTENLVHVLEDVSARLKQLETKTHRLESSVYDLVVSAGKIVPDWMQALSLKKIVQDGIAKVNINTDAVLGIGLTATALGLMVGRIIVDC